MSNLFQPGCNPNGQVSSNHFKRGINHMQVGNQNPESLMKVGPQTGHSSEEEIMKREMAFQAMNQGWGEASNL